MAGKYGKKKGFGSLTYFYYEGELYRKIRIDRPANIVWATRVRDGVEVTLSHTDWKRKRGKAFDTQEVSKIINRAPGRLYFYINMGRIKAPQRTSPVKKFDGSARYLWSEEDILNLHDYLVSVGSTRVTKSGYTVPARNLPNRAEVKAQIGRGTVLYVKTDSGEFVPTWKEPDF